MKYYNVYMSEVKTYINYVILTNIVINNLLVFVVNKIFS
jgi:hypothetical protein